MPDIKLKSLLEFLRDDEIEIPIEEYNAIMTGNITGVISKPSLKNQKATKPNAKKPETRFW
jgi:hypothetical protein